MKKKISVFTAKKAIKDYNSNLLGFNEIVASIRPRKETISPEIAPGSNPDEVMARSGMPASFSAKRAASKSLGLNSYKGTSDDDMALGRTMQARNETRVINDKENSEKSIKEKEIALKEKQLSQATEKMKMPTADEIAEAIIKKYKE